MKFYRQLIESIIDIPRKTYAPGVFDNADTENPKLKQKVLDMIDKQIAELVRKYPNDMELGKAIRDLYFKELRKGLGLKDESKVG